MRVVLYVCLIAILSGCFGPTKFSASNESEISESTQKIIDELPLEQRKEFQDAITYFSFGGKNGLGQLFGLALTGNVTEASTENLLVNNLKSLDGLTGEQIISKYYTTVTQEREQEEKERVEREKIEMERNKVKKLKGEAEALLKGKKFKEALVIYESMSGLPLGKEESKTGIEKTTLKMKEFVEKMEYIEKIEITELEAKRIDTYLKENIPAVRVSLKNNGGRSLDKVEIVVYFKDKNGKVIYEENYLPVLVSEYSFGKDNKPLKAGYIQEMEQGRYYTLKSPLSDWQEGNVSIKIVDIRFSEI